MYMYIQYGSLQQLGLGSHCLQHLALDIQSLLVLTPECMSHQSLCSGPAADTNSLTQRHGHMHTPGCPASGLPRAIYLAACLESCLSPDASPPDTHRSPNPPPGPPVSPAVGWDSSDPCDSYLLCWICPWGHSWLTDRLTSSQTSPDDVC